MNREDILGCATFDGVIVLAILAVFAITAVLVMGVGPSTAVASDGVGRPEQYDMGDGVRCYAVGYNYYGPAQGSPVALSCVKVTP